MADLSDIPDEAVTAGVENLRDWLLTADIGLDEFERMGPLSATDVVRGVLAAALPVLNTARDAETTDLLRTAVFEISQMRADWVNAYLDRAQKAWRGKSWRSTDADRVEREAIDKWNASRPGLIALWKSYQDRAASLRGEQR